MENFFFLIIGMLLMYLILQKPLQITIHHKNENVIPPVNNDDVKKLEEEMLKEDPKNDTLYTELDKIMIEANNIMGGSDRQ